MLLKKAKQHKQLISITPLIDVVFILLLFFMLSSTFNRTKQIELNTSPTGKQQLSSNTKRMLLQTMDKLSINGISYSLNSDEFTLVLTRIAEANDKVIVAATSQVSVQQVIQLIDKAQSAGINNLSLSKSVTL